MFDSEQYGVIITFKIYTTNTYPMNNLTKFVRMIVKVAVLTIVIVVGYQYVAERISAKTPAFSPFNHFFMESPVSDALSESKQSKNAVARDTSKLKITRFHIDDDSVGQSRGNSNGVIDANEKVQVSIAVKNVSTTVQSNLVLNVQATNTNITLQNNIIEIGSLQPGATWNQVNQNIVVVANTSVGLNDVSDFIFYTTQNNQEIHREKFVVNLQSPFLLNSISDSWYTTNSYQADTDMAYDSKGEAYAVWADTRYNGAQADILFARTTNGGFTFTAPVRVSTTNGYLNASPKIRINNQDEVLISWVFQENQNNHYDIYTRVSSNSGVLFSNPVKITNPQTSYNRFAPYYNNYDLNGYNNAVYVVWPTVVDATTDTGTMYLSTSTNDGQTFATSQLPNMPQPGQYLFPYLSLRNELLVLSYINQFQTPTGALTAYFMQSADGGQTFSNPIEFPTVDDEFHSYPRAFFDDAGILQLVWNEQPSPMNYAYYARSTDGGQTFEHAQWINSTLYGFSQDAPSLVSLNSKELVVTYNEMHSDGLSIFTSRDSGQSFSDRVRLTSTNVNDFISNRSDITNINTSAVPFWEDYDTSIIGSILTSLSYAESSDNIQTIGMNTGWNLIALKVQPFESLSAEELLQAANTQGNTCDQVARWNSQTANWQLFPGSNFQIDPYEGYFIRCSGYGNYLLRGEPLDFSVTSLPIVSGNTVGLFSIGVPVNDIYTAQSLCSTIANNSQKECVVLYRWENGGWDPYLPEININNFDLRIGRGYLVQLKMKGSKSQSLPIKPLP